MNPYSIKPADPTIGFGYAVEGLKGMAEKKKEKKQTAEDQAAIEEFAAASESMTGAEFTQFLARNPRVAKIVTEATSAGRKMTNEEDLHSAYAVARAYITGEGGEPTIPNVPQPAAPPSLGFEQALPVSQIPVGQTGAAPAGQSPIQQPSMTPIGQDPVQPTGQPVGVTADGEIPQTGNPAQDNAVKALTERAELVMERGGDAAGTIEGIRDTMTGGEKAFKGAMAVIAARDPQGFDRLMKLQGGGEKKSTPATDIDDFVSDAVKVYSAANPNASESDIAKESNRARLQIKRAQKEEAGGVAGARKTAELDVISQMQPGIDRDKAITVYQAGQEEKRNQTAIDNGLIAAESMPNIKRGLDLLKGIQTGGIDNVKLAAKRFFGVEGANEGELSNRLAKAVLSQLRNTFGAQFTEGEGQRLIRIEAGFDKSPENNQRLLNQALMMAQGKVDIALKIAEGKGDQAAVDQINSWTGFDLGAEAGSSLPAGVTEEKIKHTMQKYNMTRQQVLDKVAGGQ